MLLWCVVEEKWGDTETSPFVKIDSLVFRAGLLKYHDSYNLERIQYNSANLIIDKFIIAISQYLLFVSFTI